MKSLLQKYLGLDKKAKYALSRIVLPSIMFPAFSLFPQTKQNKDDNFLCSLPRFSTAQQLY